MFHYVLKTANSYGAVVNIIKDAIVAGIAWRNTVEGTSVDAIFEAFSASIGGLIGISEFALMADWCTESPAAC